MWPGAKVYISRKNRQTIGMSEQSSVNSLSIYEDEIESKNPTKSVLPKSKGHL